MTAKQFQNLLKKKHRAVIGAQFCFFIAFAIVIGNQHNTIEARDQRVGELQQTLHDISAWHQDEWESHYLSLESALNLPEAFAVGGEAEWDKEIERYQNEYHKAYELKEKIRIELEEYGIVVPHSNPDDPKEIPTVTYLR